MTEHEFLLPAELRRLLGELGADLRNWRISRTTLADAITALDVLPPDGIVRASAEIAQAAGLSYGYVTLNERSECHRKTMDLLAAYPTFARLLVFHADGYAREAALTVVNGPAASPFAVASIVLRLNDWVGEVRAAAELCARRVFPETAADVIAPAAFALLSGVRNWRRWGEGAPVLTEAFFREDVVARLADLLATKRVGPLGRVLWAALPHPEIDRHLPRLARKAFLPSIRAISFRCLLEGQAIWQNDHRREWVDKVYNRSRRVPITERRPIERFVKVESLIDMAARDRSAMVRRVAADSVIQRRSYLPGLDHFMALLAGDKSQAVRERMAFIEKERTAATSTAVAGSRGPCGEAGG